MLENLSGEELKNQFKQNKSLRMITIGVGALVVLILGYFLYSQFIYLPKEEESKSAYYQGLNYAVKDSTDKAIDELRLVVNKYDGKTGGEIAQFVYARQLMEKGEFKKAIEELDGVSLDDQFVAVHAIGLQGDCYSELGDYSKAMEYYEDAASKNENEKTSPEYLFKAALCAEQLKDFEKAKELYQNIKDNYLNFSNIKTIDKYLARVSNIKK